MVGQLSEVLTGMLALCLCLGALLRSAQAFKGPRKTGLDLGKAGIAAVQHGCVILGVDGAPSFSRGSGARHAGAAACGSYMPGPLTNSGWYQLSISTSPAFTDEQQSLALGYLEGWLSAPQIYVHHHNVWAHFNLSSDALLDWLELQDEWTREQAAHSGGALWAAMRLLHTQMDGLRAGYSARREHELQMGEEGGMKLPLLGHRDFLFISAVGDIDPLKEALSSEAAAAVARKWEALSPHEMVNELHSAGRCSAVVLITPDLSNLFLGHSAWFTFGAMVRLYKHYDMALHNELLPLRRMSFSSYPGELSSDDDFYLLSTGLAVLQTTNSVFNSSLYSLLTPQSILSWQRARIACFTARDGKGWTDVIAQHNSGTGNNQWMVVDLKLFEPGQELPKGLLWIVEQMPGLVAASDQTDTLERGYWPSYSIPYHPEVYHASGYPEFVSQQAARGAAYGAAAVAGVSYQLAPRAQIFRRDVHDVHDMASLKALLRSNAWPSEPFSGGTALGALCGRGDLDPHNARAYGCYDSKATSWSLALELEADAVVGPTRGSGAPPFAWSSAGALADQVSHVGQPDVFDYSFERMVSDPARWLPTALAAAASAAVAEW